MSIWHEENLQEKIRDILEKVPCRNPGHHLGMPFLTAYQLAIEFEKSHSEIVARLDMEIGGRDLGLHTSLSQYLAREISRHIEDMPDIEGGFLSNKHLEDISFNNQGKVIHSSLTDSGSDLSIFRFKGN